MERLNHQSALDYRQGPRRRWRGRFIFIAILLVALTGSVVATIALMRSARPPTHQVHIVTDLVPLRKALAEQIRAEGSRHGLDVVLSSKHYGALEALKEVDAPNEFKLALVPGGITAGQYANVRTVTTLTTEPLHVLVRPELADRGFAALRGKRINIGPVTTCSHHLAREVLEFVGLTPSTKSSSGGYVLETTSPEDLSGELTRMASLGEQERAQAVGKLPDAVMFLASMPSQLARQLVRGIGYHFLPVPFGEAFCLDRLNPSNSNGVRVDRAALTTSVIPTYTYGADPPVPAKACPTISAPLLLVAQDDTDPDVVYHLLEIVHDSPLTSALRPPPLREQLYSFPLFAPPRSSGNSRGRVNARADRQRDRRICFGGHRFLHIPATSKAQPL
jgi:NMT1-like family